MALETTDNRVQAQGDGLTTLFSFTFKVFLTTDLTVYKVRRSDGALTLQVLDTDYTVSIVSGVDGGSITYTTAPLSTEDSLIIREVPLTQSTVYPIESNLPEKTFENSLDKATMITQQLEEQLGRSIQLPVSSETTGLALPEPEADKLVGWNGDADALENKTIVDASTTPLPALVAEGVLGVNDAGTGYEMKKNFLNTAELTEKTENYTLGVADIGKVLTMNNAAARAFTFPNIAGDEVYIVKNIGAGTCTLTPDGSDTIEIASLAQDESVILIGDGGNSKWRVLAAYVGVPVTGMIQMWSGTIASIPGGWVLCDGTNGTPDLRDRMVICATQDDGGVAKTNVTGSLTQSGGVAAVDISHVHTTSGHTLVESEMPAHNHEVDHANSLGGQGSVIGGTNTALAVTTTSQSTGGGGSHTHGNTGSAGSATQTVLNPYYALAFIMRV